MLHFGDLGSTSCIGMIPLVGDDSILDTVYKKTPFFYPISKKAKGCIFLDQVFHGKSCKRPSKIDIQSVNAWVDVKRKLDFVGNN